MCTNKLNEIIFLIEELEKYAEEFPDIISGDCLDEMWYNLESKDK